MHSRTWMICAALALALFVGVLGFVLAHESALARASAPEWTPRATIQSASPDSRVVLSAPSTLTTARDVASSPATVPTSTTFAAFGGDPSPSRAGVGILQIRGIDAGSGEELHSVRVRALSPTRIADEKRSGGAEITLRLTPDSYAVLVLSPGYEPLEWPIADIRPRDEYEVRTAALRPGSARIDGRVWASTQDLAGFRVELIGVGRRPCARCADASSDRTRARARAWDRSAACERCGFARDASLRPLSSEGSFSFDRLASGKYVLQLVDPDGQRDWDVRIVEVRDAELVVVELPGPIRRTIELEIHDVDGLSLAPEWSRRLAAMEAASTEGALGSVWTCEFRDGLRTRARCEFVSPLAGVGALHAISGRRLGAGRSTRADDRQRKETDSLYPATPEPKVEPIVVSCELRSSGLVQFRALPGRALTLEVACAGFVGTVSVPQSESRVAVHLRRLDEHVDSKPDVRPVVPRTFREYEASRWR